MEKLQIILNNAPSYIVSMVWVSIRLPRILSGDVFIDNPHAVDVYWGHPGKSQCRSRWRLPTAHR